mmetsp:Transcript_42522/g.121202  ORF Transcript_42522/g.121202 Transcript_42522/m.121202 type:complete len:228 (+) Transcript_42522:3-686(+)
MMTTIKYGKKCINEFLRAGASVNRHASSSACRLRCARELNLLPDVLMDALRELCRNLLAGLLEPVCHAVGKVVDAVLHVLYGLVDAPYHRAHPLVEDCCPVAHGLHYRLGRGLSEVLEALNCVACGRLDVVHGAVGLGDKVPHALLQLSVDPGDLLVHRGQALLGLGGKVLLELCKLLSLCWLVKVNLRRGRVGFSSDRAAVPQEEGQAESYDAGYHSGSGSRRSVS